MLKRILFFVVFWGIFAFAQDNVAALDSSAQLSDGARDSVVTSSAAVASSSSVESANVAQAMSSSSVAVKSREVPVRYLINGDSAEIEAIFVKIENDTVYLKKPSEQELKHIERLVDEENLALQESNGNQVADTEEDEEVDLPKPVQEIIMTDAVKDSMSNETLAVEAAPVDDGSGDDLETALAKEEDRLKNVEIEKLEAEIRNREIQDSIEAAKKNPYIKIFRFELKRLYNMADEVMIDLSLSDYVVPEIKVVEETIQLYPAGKANLFVESEPAACSLFVNGIPLKITAPDTIKNIKPGKYTISVMKVLKDVEWWGSAVVRINADSLNKVKIPVLRPETRLTLNSNPEAAEVYLTEPSVNRMPDYMTDKVVEKVKPQVQTTIYFRKVGYRDTSLTVEIKPYMPNLVYVDMTPVMDDLPFIESQNAFNKERKQRRLGRGLLWGSIAPILAGGVMWYLAERDWSDAADKKKAYEKLSAFDSKDTQQMVRDNHRLNDSGDKKVGVAIGLGAIGVGLLAAGIVLAF